MFRLLLINVIDNQNMADVRCIYENIQTWTLVIILWTCVLSRRWNSSTSRQRVIKTCWPTSPSPVRISSRYRCVTRSVAMEHSCVDMFVVMSVRWACCEVSGWMYRLFTYAVLITAVAIDSDSLVFDQFRGFRDWQPVRVQ